MTPRTVKQDKINDDIITDIRLKVGGLESDLRYLKEGQAVQGKKLDVLVENSQRFATESQMLSLEKKIDEKLKGKVDTSDFKVVKGVLTLLGSAALLYLANVALPRLFA